MTAPTINLIARWGGRIRGQNVRLYSGDDATLSFTVIDDATNAAKDITGASATLGVYQRFDRQTAQFTKTGTISTGTDGVVTFAVADSDTASLKGDDYAFEVQLTESGGAIGTVAVGWLRLKEDRIS